MRPLESIMGELSRLASPKWNFICLRGKMPADGLGGAGNRIPEIFNFCTAECGCAITVAGVEHYTPLDQGLS